MREMNEQDLEDYKPVSERIIEFYRDHPEGRLIVSVIEHHRKSGFVMMKCESFRNPTDVLPAATGHASEYRSDGDINQWAYIENCETSSRGRALGGMGYGVDRHMASREEILKMMRLQGASRIESCAPEPTPNRQPARPTGEWDRTPKGKLILVLAPDQPEPPEIACPIHDDRLLKRRTNANGSWLSHKDGDGDDWCKADFRRKPRPDAASVDLRAKLQAANNGHHAHV